MDEAVMILRNHSSLLGIHLTERQENQFSTYSRLLGAWNQEMNLTALESPADIAIKHFYDSLTVTQCLEAELNTGAALVDVGTGAGFPGVPLKICFEDLDLTLVDSLKKRVGFLEQLISELKLENTRAMWARAEEIGQDVDFRERYEIVTARAVAPLAVLVEYCLPLVSLGGKCVLLKGAGCTEEVTAAETAIRLLGGEIVEVLAVKIPVIEQSRYLVTLRKTSPTPSKYPRRPGMPKKRPIQQHHGF